jgi:hypothetical protein
VNRQHHVLIGAVAGMGYAAAQGLPSWQCLISAGLAGMAGPAPDVDNRRWWKRLDRLLPDEWLGHGGPLQHRGLTHWWVLPAVGWTVAAHEAPEAWWVFAMLAGWISHLAGDLAFGEANRYAHRGPGVPIGPWFWHVGVGLKSGGLAETVLTPVIAAAGAAWAVITLTDAWPLVHQLTSTL